LMVREFEETTNDNLLLIVDPWAPAESPQSRQPSLGQASDADRVLEDAVSLAASICWEWCRQKDDHLTLAVAGARPVVVSGITGHDLAVRCLEQLAIVRGSTESRSDELCDLLMPSRIPAGPVLVVSTRASDVIGPVSGHLQRPITDVNAARLDECDFYERPADHAN
jgi:uncharacterized protein (DUF58 family)